MQFRIGPSAVAVMLAACAATAGCSNDGSAPLGPVPTPAATTPTPQADPTTSDAATPDDTPTTADATSDPTSKPPTANPKQPCDAAEVNPHDCADVLAYLKSGSRAKRYQDIVPRAGLKVAQTLLTQEQHGKTIRIHDASGNSFTSTKDFNGWADLASADGTSFVRVYLRDGQIATKVETTAIVLRDKHHTSTSEVAIVTPTRASEYWLGSKCTGDTLRVTDLRFFTNFQEPRQTVPGLCGGTATIVGPTNLADAQTLDWAILGRLRDDLKINFGGSW